MKVFLIVGPSGSGKDTLIRCARDHFRGLGQLIFVRRYITRCPDRHEDNFFVDPEGFRILEQADFFISTWQAHSNSYGVPWSEFQHQNETARICSISRTAVDDFETIFPDTRTIEITAKTEVLAARLDCRGRESNHDIEKRLARSRMPVVAKQLITFDNSTELTKSRNRFIDLLDQLVFADTIKCR